MRVSSILRRHRRLLSGQAGKFYHYQMGLEQRFHSLEDFLASKPGHVDGTVGDGCGSEFPVKGREIEATILFADISGFSTRTANMTPIETLIFVQTFFAWITKEALADRPGIVDKYIGDEVMVIFAKEFGSQDPFLDAVQAAGAMSKHDIHVFCPHIGIASGQVIVGYAGTPLRYNVSVFGAPVALAARCAALRPDENADFASSTIVFPEVEWGSRGIDEVLPPTVATLPDGSTHTNPQSFHLQDARDFDAKGVGIVKVREIYNSTIHVSEWTVEGSARYSARLLYDNNRYWPRWKKPPKVDLS
jgi:hypothetical protein